MIPLIFDKVGNGVQWVVKNWSKIKPLVIALIAALTLYGMVLAAIKIKLAFVTLAHYKLIVAQKAGMIIGALSTAYTGFAIAVDMVRKGETLAAAAQWLLNTAMKANPVGLVVAGVAAGAYLLIKNWDKVKSFFTGLWNWLKKSWKDIMLTVFLPFIGIPMLIIKNWSKIKGFFGGGKKGKTTKTPKYATGTAHHPGGWAMVGERGRELLNFPRGSQVVPNNRTESLLNGLSGAAGTNLSFTYAPQIDARGNANPGAITEAINDSYEEFKRNMSRFVGQNKRLNFVKK